MPQQYRVVGAVPVVIKGVERRSGDVVVARDCAPGQLEFLLASGALEPAPADTAVVAAPADGEE